MKVSIITAVYNRVATIGMALDCVAAQTHPDIEHIVIDACSSDGTLELIEQRKVPGTRVISEPDRGIYDALTKGSLLASGDIVGLVHSDDVLAHDRVIARVVEAFADPAVDAVYGDLDYVAADDIDRVIRHWRSSPFSPASLAWGWMPPHPALFVRKRLIERHGAYDLSYSIAGDYDAILRWFGSGIQAVHIPEVLVKMRVGGESNRSLERILRKSREDYRALRTNGVGGLGALMAKNLRKVPQFFPH